jgi:radical SAM superfamily enzyme YgiQ (UPF0313 family)
MKQMAKYGESIKKIQENGIIAFGAFVIGFEHDDLDSFDRIKEFTLQNNIPGQFTLLTPIPGSQLYQDLKVKGKLFEDKFWSKCGFYNLVFKHKNMTPIEAQESLIKLYNEVYQPENSLRRFFYMKDIYKNLPPRWQYNKLILTLN